MVTGFSTLKSLVIFLVVLAAAAPLMGQTLVPNQTSLTFGYQGGGQQPAAQQVTVSSSDGSGIHFNITVTQDQPWVWTQQLLTSADTGQVLTIAVNPSFLDTANLTRVGNGPFTATITLTPTNPSGLAAATITATLNIGGSTTTGLSASPASLTFNSGVGGGVQYNYITLSTASSNVPYTVAVSQDSTYGGYTWLSVSSGASGTTVGGTAQIQVQIAPAGLIASSYTGSVTMTGGGQTATVRVYLTVGSGGGSGTGTLSVSPNTLTFTYQTGGAAPGTQYIQIFGVSSYSANVSSYPWLLLGNYPNNPSSSSVFGSGSTYISVGINPAYLGSQQSATGTVFIQATDGTGYSYNLPVYFTLNGIGGGTGNITPSSLTFNSAVGGASQTQYLSSSTGITTGISFSPTGSWLSAYASGNQVIVTANPISPSYLSANTYSGSVFVNGYTVPITFTVGSGSGTGSISPSFVTFNSAVGGASQTQYLSSSTGITTGVSFSPTGSWLSAYASGNQVIVTANPISPTYLSANTYSGSVFVNGYTIPVTFTVGSGSGTGSISPSFVTFSAAVGGASQTQYLSSSTGITTGVSFSPTGSWLSAYASGNQVIVTANPISPTYLSANTYSGSVFVNGYTIPVTFTVGSGSGTGSITPSFVTFNAAVGGASQTQYLSSSTGITTGVSFSPTGSWLAAYASGNQVIVTANPISPTYLSANTYSGSVFVNGYTIPVTFTVGSGSGGTGPISPSTLTFNSAVGGSSQTQYLSSSTGITTGVSFTPTGSWLSAYASGSQVIVSANAIYPTYLAANTYTGSVFVNGYTIPITFNVGTGGTGVGAVGTVTPTALTFSYQLGSSSSVPYQTVIVPGGTTPTLSVTYPSGATQGWISANQSTTPGAVTVGILPSVFTSAGTYTATLMVNNYPVSITVNATASPIIVANASGQSSLLFNFNGTRAPDPLSIQLNSSTPASQMTFTATSNVNWLSVTPTTGITPGFVNVQVVGSVVGFGTGAATESNNNTDAGQTSPSALGYGVYSGTITVTATGAVNSPLLIPVILNVTSGGASTGVLTFSPTSVVFTGVPGGGVTSQQLTVNAATTTFFTVTPGCNWLTLSASSGNTYSVLTLTANPAGLGATTYSCNLNFTANGQSQTLPVTFNLGGGGQFSNVSLSPATLSFDYQVGATAPAVQNIQVSSFGAPVSYTVTALAGNNGSWLSVNAPSGSTPGTIPVSITPTNLAAGTYNGTVTVTPSGGAPVIAAVSLTVRAAPSISLSSTSLTFNFRAGDQNPAAQTVQVLAGGSSVAYTVTTSSSGWLAVDNTTGTTPGSLSISVTPGSLASGTYNGTVTVTPTSGGNAQVINVGLTVTAPLPTITRVTNAATYNTGAVAPGEIVTIFGTNMAGASDQLKLTVDSTGTVTLQLGDVRVLFNGIAAPLVFASADQISTIVPYSLAGRAETTIQVDYRGVRSNGVSVPVTTTAPGIFTLNASGSGPGAILNQDGSTNTPNAPATKGTVVVIFATGEGQGFPSATTGKITTGTNLPRPLLPVSVTIDGQPATVQYSGAAPGLVAGALQLNVVVPTAVGSGNLPVVLTIGNNSNSPQNVTVAVR